LFTSILVLTSHIASASLPSAIVVIHGQGTRGPYLLGYHNLVQNSFSLYNDSLTFKQGDYSVQFVAGLVHLTNPLPVGDSIYASFQYIPLSLKQSYSLHQPAAPRDRNERPAIPFKRESTFSTGDLEITGSKGFSIETGSNAGGLSQSLNLTINGNIVSGLKTSAHISDKSGGSAVSRRLEEIDKIYIEAESDYFKGTFGDFEYVSHLGEFGEYRRKLTGLDANYHRDNKRIIGSAAFFPGQYSSMTINGEDGRLGPYYLQGNGGREGAAILPGSERVYVDGILQKRGSDNDYTIDYETGALEFTPSKIISEQSRITVDYEISREEYSRSFYSIGGRGGLREGLKVFGFLMQEGDRGGSPKSFELNEENRAILENAGGDYLNASRNGAEFVGADNGEYISVSDTAGAAYFEYAGPNQGDYHVAFSFVGKNTGSYSSRGGGIFEFVGPGSGDYDPIILLPLPQIKRYGQAGMSYAAPESLVFMNSEILGSYYDKNTVSNLDKPLSDFSGTIMGGVKKQLFSDEGYIGISGKIRSIGSEAVFPGRIDSVERYRSYDLPPESGSQGERNQEVRFEGGFNEFRRVILQAGRLHRPEIKDRFRQAGEIDFKITGPLDWFGNFENTEGDRYWRKRSTGMRAGFARLQPSISVDFESRNGTDGFRFYEYRSACPAIYTSGLSGNTEISYRQEQYLESGWRDRFNSYGMRQKVEFYSGGSGLSGAVAGAYYKKKYADYTGTDSDQKSGSVRTSFTDPSGRGEISINERLSTSNERLRTKTYLYVGGGDGDYRYEDGEYISDPDGDYVLLIEELGQGSRISEITTEINGSVSPFKIADKSGDLESNIGRVLLETELTYRLRKTSNVLKGKDFFPWANSNTPLLNNGRLDLRLFYYPAGTAQRWKYSMNRSFQDGNPFANETVSERSSSDELTWSFSPVKKVDIVLGGFVASTKRSTNGIGYSIKRHKESFKSDYKFFENWILQTSLGFESARQTDVDITATIPSVGLGLVREFRGKGRISSDITYFRLLANPRGSYIPYQMAQGKREGDNLTFGAKARLEVYKNGRLDFVYRYEKFASRQRRQNMKMEFTILFQ